MEKCPDCGVSIDDTWRFCIECGAQLQDDPPEQMDLDINDVVVSSMECTCGQTFYVVYKEEEAKINMEAVASKIGLGTSIRSKEPTVVGSHSVECPKCGSNLTLMQMAKMKIAGVLFSNN